MGLLKKDVRLAKVHIAITAMADKPLALPSGLYALIDDSVGCAVPLEQAAAEAVAGGAAVLQLRLERTPDREALELIRAVVPAARAAGVPVLVNDRVDLALVGRADGVHLGDQDLPVADARRLLGPRALIGATARDLAGIERARAEGADHVGVGPVFATRTKAVPFALLGPAGLQAIAAKSPLPVVAIAGVDATNIGSVAAAGAHCAAVASALLRAPSIREAARALHDAFVSNRTLAR